MAKRVFVAMSGGVDSSAAAYLLLEAGYDVAGVTMDIFGGKNAALNDASKVAGSLGIKHHVFDFSREFDELVIQPFVNEYLSGGTPNPCVLCNKNIKWGMLLSKALELGADYVATGHYARVVAINGRYSLKKADFAQKDQTYALYGLSQAQLEKTLFPLGKYSKAEVRRFAAKAGLDVSDKPDSQEICFIENGGYSRFIKEYTVEHEEKGEFVLSDGTVLGTHNGISNYTIGQRKGLGISYSEPLFVLKVDKATNSVVLGRGEELFSREFTVRNANFLSVSSIKEKIDCSAKIRYAHNGAPCSLEPIEGFADRLFCRFNEPQRAITPGQSAVFYDDDGVVIAGGIIRLE